ncbi:hypothetical protein RGU71_05960 [Bacillus thuringiensis]|uniref:hypothetical protein n=1 Tax=Bacillus thuringiensis TaxID=1428 RepID=UPI0028536BF7|nr:hypothetical protein [Bacillus thuringiensis]MDR4920287.1 hypothetical protein [Bacillus thuringiensis]
MAKEKFSKSDLSRVASQVKRTILNQAKSGIYIDQILTKTEVYERLAQSLKISSRSLKSGWRSHYVTTWYEKTTKEIEAINDLLIISSQEDNEEDFRHKKIEELYEIIKFEKQLRKAFELKVKQLLIENEKLRTTNFISVEHYIKDSIK